MAETHIYTVIKVSCDDDFAAQIGKDIFFDLVDHDNVTVYRVQNQKPFKFLKEEIAKARGIPTECQRFWIWAKRMNRTYRPLRPLTYSEEFESIGFLKKKLNIAHNADLKIFLEVNRSKDQGMPHRPPYRTLEDILLFFKLYDPTNEELRYVGRTFVKAGGRPREILEKLNEMAGFSPNQEIDLYEEIKFEPSVMCDPVDKNTTFKGCQLEDGDIICFQKSLSQEEILECRYPHVPSYLEHVHNKQTDGLPRLPKEMAETHIYTVIKVSCDDDFAAQIGKDIFFDLVDHDNVTDYRIQKQTPFKLFKEVIAKVMGIPVKCQRFWIWAKRINCTYRPLRPLTYSEEFGSIGFLEQSLNIAHNADLKLFLEVNRSKDQGIPHRPPNRTREHILLFFKLYDPTNEELRYVGRTFVNAGGKPREILGKLNDMAGFSPNQEIDLYEEIKFEPSVMCDPVDKNTTFKGCQLGDGDIICFQKSLSQEEILECRYPHVPAYLEHVHNRQVVHFRRLEAPKEEGFFLELSKQHTYDEVVERVACELDVEDPSKIRLTAHDCLLLEPKMQPIKYRGVDRLSDMLVHNTQVSDILYFEVLDLPLPEL